MRVHDGNAVLGGARSYLPEDAAIPAPEIPAAARFTRPLQTRHESCSASAISAPAGCGAAPRLVLALYLAFSPRWRGAWGGPGVDPLVRRCPGHLQRGANRSHVSRRVRSESAS